MSDDHRWDTLIKNQWKSVVAVTNQIGTPLTFRGLQPQRFTIQVPVIVVGNISHILCTHHVLHHFPKNVRTQYSCKLHRLATWLVSTRPLRIVSTRPLRTHYLSRTKEWTRSGPTWPFPSSNLVCLQSPATTALSLNFIDPLSYQLLRWPSFILGHR